MPVRVLASLCVCLVLAACGHTPIMSIYRLSQLDAATVDIAALRAAVLVPEALRPREVTLHLSANKPGGATPRRESFLLQPVDEPDELRLLVHEAVSGSRHYIFRIAPPDVARAQRFRDGMAADRAASGRKERGSLSIAAKACRAGRLPRGSLLLTTYLKFDPGGAYVPLARDVDLGSYVDEKTLREKIPACGAQP